MDRRTYLAAIAAGSVPTALSGCGGRTDRESPTPEGRPRTTSGGWSGPEPPADVAADFDDVVNLARKGVDTAGKAAIDDVLERVAADGRLVYLPPGRYKMADEFAFEEFSRFGLVGRDATIVPRSGYDGVLFDLGAPGEASYLRVEGLRFDVREPDTGVRPILGQVDDELIVRDVAVRGKQDVDQDLFRFDVTAPDGRGLIERLYLPDGGDARWRITGCELGDENRGDVTFRDCTIEGFPDNGLYADPPEGDVSVLRGYYANNGVASVRVNAGEQSVVRGVHVRCDRAPDGFENMRGIRLRGGESLLVEDCLVELLDVTESDGAITFSSELGSGTVRNTRIRVDADRVNAIRIKSPYEGREAGLVKGPFECSGVEITGTAAGRSAILAANRDRCLFENVCIHQPGADRNGIQTDGVEGVVRDSTISVTGVPTLFRDSAVETYDVRERPPHELDPDEAVCA